MRHPKFPLMSKEAVTRVFEIHHPRIRYFRRDETIDNEFREVKIQNGVSDDMVNEKFIYIMTHKNLPGLVKIGVSHAPEERAVSVARTIGLDGAMEVEMTKSNLTSYTVEAAIHNELRELQVREFNDKKLGDEFFRIKVIDAVKTIVSYTLPTRCTAMYRKSIKQREIKIRQMEIDFDNYLADMRQKMEGHLLNAFVSTLNPDEVYELRAAKNRKMVKDMYDEEV